MPSTPTRTQPPRTAMEKVGMIQTPQQPGISVMDKQISDENNIDGYQSISSQFQILKSKMDLEISNKQRN